jgi:hypothetical protein
MLPAKRNEECQFFFFFFFEGKKGEWPVATLPDFC